MSEAVAQNKKDNKNEKTADTIGKVDIVKTEQIGVTNADPKDKYAEIEKLLLSAVRTLLREHGIRKSGAAIRDAVEMPHDKFAPQQAVSALSTLGFKSSFGSVKLKKLSNDLFPLIAFMKDGSAKVLKETIR